MLEVAAASSGRSREVRAAAAAYSPGQIPASQDAQVDTYGDSVVETVNF